MSESRRRWEFVFVLPNLVLTDDPDDGSPAAWPNGISVAPDAFVIVPGTDARVGEIRAANRAVDQLLSSFLNQHGKPYFPAILVASPDALPGIAGNLEAIVAFRNAIALAIVLRARAAVAKGDGNLDPTWSDTFDFHPAQLSTSGNVVLQSPALWASVSSTAKLTLSHSPYVPLLGRRLWPDTYLMRSLGNAWRRRYTSQRRRDRFSASLFRSLEVAYQALSVGAKNEGSIHDYGVQIAQWVSAIEVLAWPAHKHANIESVLTLLGRIEGRPELQHRRYRARMRGETRSLTAVQRAYVYLYNARNRFLHGNPVTDASLFTRARSGRIALPRLAALVYRAALVAYLDVRYPKTIRSVNALIHRQTEMFDDHSYDQGLAALFGINL